MDLKTKDFSGKWNAVARMNERFLSISIISFCVSAIALAISLIKAFNNSHALLLQSGLLTSSSPLSLPVVTYILFAIMLVSSFFIRYFKYKLDRLYKL